MEAPLPADESERIHALHGLGILYTPAEERFDRITRLAQQLFDVPIALISLVDSDCQWFKSAQGLRAPATSRAVSFCAHAILDENTMVISDARSDPRFADSPLVTGNPNIRFYAGHPILAPDGSKLGTLCVIDNHPRQIDEKELNTLRTLAGWVDTELKVTALSQAQVDLISELDELRRKALIDTLTRLWNRPAIMDVIRRELARAQRKGESIALMMLDIDYFKAINDTHGHVAGDEALAVVAGTIRAALRFHDAIGRYGGEEFLICLSTCDKRTAINIAERIRNRVASHSIAVCGKKLSLTVSLGVVVNESGTEWDPIKLIKAADAALYRAKADGRNRFELAAV